MARQLAMVMDINKCYGCQSCSVACKVLWTDKKGMEQHWWRKTNTMPGRGFPRDWDKMGGGFDKNGAPVPGRKPTAEEYGCQWDFRPWEVFTSGGFGPGDKPHQTPGNVTWGPNWDEDIGAGEWPNGYMFYLPRNCMQCSRPSCATACPYGAISKRASDGIVVIDEGTCQTKCSEPVCIAGCPYKELFYNSRRQAVQKCDLCSERLQAGVAPSCVRQCPGRGVWIDFMDNEGGPVYKLVNEWKVALPLHAEWGTLPNVFYVPPLSPPRIKEVAPGIYDVEGGERIPREYLRSLFGGGVDAALETLQAELAKSQRHEESEVMRLLIVRRSRELMGPFLSDPSDVVRAKE